MNNYCHEDILYQVPLNYDDLQGSSIQLFARHLYSEENKHAELLFFFNGGPGLSCIRDWKSTEWIMEALKKYRVVLIDQRGTGRSQLIDITQLKNFSSAEELKIYLANFRADNIVRDAEYLRKNIFRVEKINVLGQSFGGFVVLTYLSFFSSSINHAYITAGVAPLMSVSVQEVYESLIKGVIHRNERFYSTYPEDKKRVQAIISALRGAPFKIGNEFLTLERFLDLGWFLGQENGDHFLHYLLDEAFCDESMQAISWQFGKRVLEATSFWEVNPLYAIMHESIYCNGYGSFWAADNVIKMFKEFSFDQEIISFSGEMIKRYTFSDYVGLNAFSIAANLLSDKADWPLLYDIQQLRKNAVPLRVLLIKDDFYVSYEQSKKALENIRQAHVWEHSSWQHDALRKHGKEVIRGLFTL